MSSSTGYPTLIKPSKPDAGGDQFLAFLNLGKQKAQKTAEHNGTGPEIEKQELGTGSCMGDLTRADTSLTAHSVMPHPVQKRSLLEKRKREDVPRGYPSLSGSDVKASASSWALPISWLEGLGHQAKDVAGADTGAPPMNQHMSLDKDTTASADSGLPSQAHQDNSIAPDALAPSSRENVEHGEQTHDHSVNHSQASSVDESPLTPGEELTIIDPEGDLRVTIGTIGSEITALCSSPCLRRASPKWKALIDASPTEIHLEEDIEMVLDLLRIAHAQFAGLPTHTIFDELLAFARICRVYEVTELVRPWMHIWVDPWMGKALDPGYEGCIFVAWIFGYQETFDALTQRLASTAAPSRVDIPENVLELFDLELRTIIVDNILRIRNLVIPDILSICNSQVSQLSDERSPKSCRVSEDCVTGDDHSELCDCIALGSLQRGLKSIGLWPPYPPPDTSPFTIQSLQTQLDGLHLLSYPGHEEQHSFCRANEEFHNALHLNRKQVPTLQVAHKEHFESFIPMIDDPLVWKSKAVEKMGFLERDFRDRDHESDSESDETFLDPELKPENDDEANDLDDEENDVDQPSFIDPFAGVEDDEDEDEDYEESDEESGSEPDEEYLDSGEESDYTSDVEEEEPVEAPSKTWPTDVTEDESVEEDPDAWESESEELGCAGEDSTVTPPREEFDPVSTFYY
ncbi:hypothetical protein BU16DRAFT_615943 [Lophium mytilinum]|uniref:BTB domain-containing protein n=1 Tax=Lophium mytilinum TaxID=390894 RepID=A0A6A6R5F2_9PEZI|nr:hypothetical protein BU16DRAFT_615943 [Lophium mytilinum]